MIVSAVFPLGFVRTPPRSFQTPLDFDHLSRTPLAKKMLALYGLKWNSLAAPTSCTRPELEPVPSYATLRRFMSHNGLARRRRVTARRTDGAERAEARIADREVRSYETEYVNALWHWDCHHGSRKVLTERGEW